MNHSTLNHLFDSIAAGDERHVLLTPNDRLARFIHEKFTAYQTSRHITSWKSLPCLSVHRWLSQLWDASLYNSQFSKECDAIVISSTESRLIWKALLSQTEGVELINTATSARIAQQAWENLRHWQPIIPESKITEVMNTDQPQVFSSWANKYENYLNQHKLIDATEQLVRLCRIIEQTPASELPTHIVFIGIDELSPLQKNFFEKLLPKSIKISSALYTTRQSVLRVRCASAQEEIHSAARWAAETLRRDPGKTIGIVIPNLAKERENVERTFRNVFEPQANTTDQNRHANGFNVSAGQALNQVPIVTTAIRALSLNSPAIPIEILNTLLHSPFIGILDELPRRAQILESLRSLGEDISPSQLRESVGRSFEKTEHGGDLFQRLQQLKRFNQSIPHKSLPSHWLEIFNKQLSLLGWPGERALDTIEFQQLNAWQKIQETFCRLDASFPQISLQKAIECLSEIAGDHTFQAQTLHSPVQVLGLLEGAGMLFDQCWVMGMDSQQWPSTISPNPFLPQDLQSHYGMPQASIARELIFCRNITARLEQSAKKVVFSHAHYQGDTPLRVSPLIEHHECISTEQLPLISDINYAARLAEENIHHQWSVDACGSVIPQDQPMKGGTQVLKDQSACPFRAFAKHRLKANSIDIVSHGISPMDHGNWVHNTLEALWKDLKNSQTLHSLTDDALQDKVKNYIEWNLEHSHQTTRLSPRLKSIEFQRIFNIVNRWLEEDKKREAFEVIATEKKYQITLSGLTIHLRLDRIDKTANKTVFLIDYKTGNVELKHWFSERPDDPQIPLYVLAQNESDHVIGVAYGQLNVKQVGYVGIAETDTICSALKLPENLRRQNAPETWQDIKEQWRHTLTTLAKQFSMGYAVVEPKAPSETCQYCDLQSLCRVKEKREFLHHSASVPSTL